MGSWGPTGAHWPLRRTCSGTIAWLASLGSLLLLHRGIGLSSCSRAKPHE